MTKKKGKPVSEETKKRLLRVLRQLKKTYPDVKCALIYESPFQLLVATILSAQCTDVRVNATTPALFKKYPTVEKLSRSTQSAVEKIIKPLGFFRAKSANIRAMSKLIVKDFDGEIPQTLEELILLPGVGRKTANVVLGTIFNIPSGVVVDTHVKRISYLLGFTTSKNTEIAERELITMLPKKEWIMWSHRLIHHGRQICIARRPNCTECPLLKNCERVDLPPL